MEKSEKSKSKLAMIRSSESIILNWGWRNRQQQTKITPYSIFHRLTFVWYHFFDNVMISFLQLIAPDGIEQDKGLNSIGYHLSVSK